MNSTDIVQNVSDYIIKFRHFDGNFKLYLLDNNIPQKYWPLIIARICRIIPDKTRNLVYDLVVDNINEIVNDEGNFIYLLETLTLNGYNSNQIHDMIINIEVSIEKLFLIYNKMLSSNEKIVRIFSSIMLGLIGRKSPESLFEEVKNNLDGNVDDKRNYMLTALFIASYKPYRHLIFNPPKFILEFVTNCLRSQNNEISYSSIATCIRLFDIEPIFFYEHMRNYLIEYDVSKTNFLQAINYENLVSNPDYELKLLIESSRTESSQVISQVLAVFANKLHDKIINKKELQKVTFDLIKKWHQHPDIQNVSKETWLLENAANADICYAFDFLLNWIIKEDDDLIMYRFYPKLIYNTFKTNEDHLISFLEKLIAYDKRFDNLIDGIFYELIFDLRLEFDSKFYIHNETTGRDLKNYLNTTEISELLDTLYAEQLDDVPAKITKALEIVQKYQLPTSNSNYKSVEHKKKELNNTLEFFKRKVLLISKCLEFLVNLSNKRGLNHDKLTRNFKGNKIPAKMTSIEILRTELFKKNSQKIDYSVIKEKIFCFPNIEILFDNKWLETKCNKGYPYHWILFWLSKMKSKQELSQKFSDWERESDPVKKEIKFQELRVSSRSLAWLNHIDNCLDYLNQKVKQGKKDIINGMKDDDNFLKFLSQLDIAKKLTEHGYNVELESQSINNKSIDIVAKKEHVILNCELATFEMYNELKYSSISADVPDRPKEKMLSKLSTQIVDYAKDRPGQPMLLIFNMTEALDADLHGIQYALHGSKVDHRLADHGSDIGRYTTFERDPEFLKIDEGRKLTGVIYYTDEFDGLNKYFDGDIILNTTAEVKLNDQALFELREALFERPTR